MLYMHHMLYIYLSFTYMYVMLCIHIGALYTFIGLTLLMSLKSSCYYHTSYLKNKQQKEN